MADTSQAEPVSPSEPQTNGIPDGVDEEEKMKMRPADIDADMREMERRKRVEMIMNSRLFREELERIIETQLKDGSGPAGLLQQISDMMGVQGGRLQSGNVFRSSNCVVPINDIRGVESMGYAKGEKILRCKLAAVYRLMDLYGWTQGIYNHITARLNQDQEHFLVNPFGMLYHEITASSLVKIDMQGVIVEPGTTNFGVNVAGFMLHSAIHAARPDIKCIIHVHTPSVLAVSSLKCGLLPLCQEAIVIGEVSQQPYLGGLFEPEEREKIARNLGPMNKVMFLANHGAVCCGETVEEAFFNVYNTVLACETQIKLMPMGVENLVLVSDETRKHIYEAARRAPDSAPKQDTSELPPSGFKKEKPWRIGGIEFEALMRMLDNAGFRTGYIYRHPLVKGELPRPRNDVEVPPAVSSLGYLLEEEEMYKQGQWKKYMDGRKTHDRTRWLNSPNVYQKVEILETGTPDPKKITKWVEANAEEWVADGSPTHTSTPVRIDSALQFVPKNTDPREFKKLQQQIKDNRRADKITSGPQSHILEGVSWEEAKKLQDANMSVTGDQVILVGAASKGIIQRGFQHNALVYKTPYAKNPFDTITDEEIEEYKKVVERKQRGESFEEDQSESEPLSSSLQNSRPTNDESLGAMKSPLLSPTSAASETEEESRDEPRVLRIETKQVPRPSQAEVVLSDAESDFPDPNVERSLSLRYPEKAPEPTDDSGQFKRSWSLGREKVKPKDNCGKVARGESRQRKIREDSHHVPSMVRYLVARYNKTVSQMNPSLTAISRNRLSSATPCVPHKSPSLPPASTDVSKENTCHLVQSKLVHVQAKSFQKEFLNLQEHNSNGVSISQQHFEDPHSKHLEFSSDHYILQPQVYKCEEASYCEIVILSGEEEGIYDGVSRIYFGEDPTVKLFEADVNDGLHINFLDVCFAEEAIPSDCDCSEVPVERPVYCSGHHLPCTSEENIQLSSLQTDVLSENIGHTLDMELNVFLSNTEENSYNKTVCTTDYTTLFCAPTEAFRFSKAVISVNIPAFSSSHLQIFADYRSKSKERTCSEESEELLSDFKKPSLSNNCARGIHTSTTQKLGLAKLACLLNFSSSQLCANTFESLPLAGTSLNQLTAPEGACPSHRIMPVTFNSDTPHLQILFCNLAKYRRSVARNAATYIFPQNGQILVWHERLGTVGGVHFSTSTNLDIPGKYALIMNYMMYVDGMFQAHRKIILEFIYKISDVEENRFRGLVKAICFFLNCVMPIFNGNQRTINASGIFHRGLACTTFDEITSEQSRCLVTHTLHRQLHFFVKDIVFIVRMERKSCRGNTASLCECTVHPSKPSNCKKNKWDFHFTNGNAYISTESHHKYLEFPEPGRSEYRPTVAIERKLGAFGVSSIHTSQTCKYKTDTLLKGTGSQKRWLQDCSRRYPQKICVSDCKAICPAAAGHKVCQGAGSAFHCEVVLVEQCDSSGITTGIATYSEVAMDTSRMNMSLQHYKHIGTMLKCVKQQVPDYNEVVTSKTDCMFRIVFPVDAIPVNKNILEGNDWKALSRLLGKIASQCCRNFLLLSMKTESIKKLPVKFPKSCNGTGSHASLQDESFEWTHHYNIQKDKATNIKIQLNECDVSLNCLAGICDQISNFIIYNRETSVSERNISVTQSSQAHGLGNTIKCIEDCVFPCSQLDSVHLKLTISDVINGYCCDLTCTVTIVSIDIFFDTAECDGAEDVENIRVLTISSRMCDYSTAVCITNASITHTWNGAAFMKGIFNLLHSCGTSADMEHRFLKDNYQTDECGSRSPDLMTNFPLKCRTRESVQVDTSSEPVPHDRVEEAVSKLSISFKNINERVIYSVPEPGSEINILPHCSDSVTASRMKYAAHVRAVHEGDTVTSAAVLAPSLIIEENCLANHTEGVGEDIGTCQLLPDVMHVQGSASTNSVWRLVEQTKTFPASNICGQDENIDCTLEYSIFYFVTSRLNFQSEITFPDKQVLQNYEDHETNSDCPSARCNGSQFDFSNGCRSDSLNNISSTAPMCNTDCHNCRMSPRTDKDTVCSHVNGCSLDTLSFKSSENSLSSEDLSPPKDLHTTNCYCIQLASVPVVCLCSVPDPAFSLPHHKRRQSLDLSSRNYPGNTSLYRCRSYPLLSWELKSIINPCIAGSHTVECPLPESSMLNNTAKCNAYVIEQKCNETPSLSSDADMSRNSSFSLSSTSLEVVTALTESTFSPALNTTSVKYYSFSSPVLDMDTEDLEYSAHIPVDILAESESSCPACATDVPHAPLPPGSTLHSPTEKCFNHKSSKDSSLSSDACLTGTSMSSYLKICFNSSDSDTSYSADSSKTDLNRVSKASKGCCINDAADHLLLDNAGSKPALIRSKEMDSSSQPEITEKDTRSFPQDKKSDSCEDISPYSSHNVEQNACHGVTQEGDNSLESSHDCDMHSFHISLQADDNESGYNSFLKGLKSFGEQSEDCGVALCSLPPQSCETEGCAHTDLLSCGSQQIQEYVEYEANHLLFNQSVTGSFVFCECDAQEKQNVLFKDLKSKCECRNAESVLNKCMNSYNSLENQCQDQLSTNNQLFDFGHLETRENANICESSISAVSSSALQEEEQEHCGEQANEFPKYCWDLQALDCLPHKDALRECDTRLQNGIECVHFSGNAQIASNPGHVAISQQSGNSQAKEVAVQQRELCRICEEKYTCLCDAHVGEIEETEELGSPMERSFEMLRENTSEESAGSLCYLPEAGARTPTCSPEWGIQTVDNVKPFVCCDKQIAGVSVCQCQQPGLPEHAAELCSFHVWTAAVAQSPCGTPLNPGHAANLNVHTVDLCKHNLFIPYWPGSLTESGYSSPSDDMRCISSKEDSSSFPVLPSLHQVQGCTSNKRIDTFFIGNKHALALLSPKNQSPLSDSEANSPHHRDATGIVPRILDTESYGTSFDHVQTSVEEFNNFVESLEFSPISCPLSNINGDLHSLSSLEESSDTESLSLSSISFTIDDVSSLLGCDDDSEEGENTVNGDDLDAPHSTFSQSSKEGSPTKDVSTEESPKKDKKKKKGLRTPSFLKKKKEKKKMAEA